MITPNRKRLTRSTDFLPMVAGPAQPTLYSAQRNMTSIRFSVGTGHCLSDRDILIYGTVFMSPPDVDRRSYPACYSYHVRKVVEWDRYTPGALRQITRHGTSRNRSPDRLGSHPVAGASSRIKPVLILDCQRIPEERVFSFARGMFRYRSRRDMPVF